jgi:hypothetical protein
MRFALPIFLSLCLAALVVFSPQVEPWRLRARARRLSEQLRAEYGFTDGSAAAWDAARATGWPPFHYGKHGALDDLQRGEVDGLPVHLSGYGVVFTGSRHRYGLALIETPGPVEWIEVRGERPFSAARVAEHLPDGQVRMGVPLFDADWAVYVEGADALLNLEFEPAALARAMLDAPTRFSWRAHEDRILLWKRGGWADAPELLGSISCVAGLFGLADTRRSPSRSAQRPSRCNRRAGPGWVRIPSKICRIRPGPSTYGRRRRKAEVMTTLAQAGSKAAPAPAAQPAPVAVPGPTPLPRRLAVRRTLHRAAGPACALVAPVAAAALLAVWRATLPNTDAALILVTVVVAVAASGRRALGLTAAADAALWFDFFLTAPYERFAITSRDDVQTTVLLFLVGAAVTEIAAQARRSRSQSATQAGYVTALHDTAALSAAGRPAAQIAADVSTRLTTLLGLISCRFEEGSFLGRHPLLRPDGELVWSDAQWDVATLGLPTGMEIELRVRGANSTLGRLMLTARPGSAPDLDARRVAAALADVLGAAIAAERSREGRVSA